MKILTTTLFCFLLISSITAQTINLKKSGDLFLIPCEVNGQEMDLYFDTGASLVSISLGKAISLLENKKLSLSDIIGKVKLTIADGQIVDGTLILIKSIKVGDMFLENIEAVISGTQEAPLLFGQSAIKKFGSFTFDYNTNTIKIIKNGKSQKKTITIPKLRQNMAEGLGAYELSQFNDFYKNKHEIINNLQVDVVRHKVEKRGEDNHVYFTFDITNNSDYDFSQNKQLHANPVKIINIVVTIITKNGKRYTAKSLLPDLLSGDTFSTEDTFLTINIRNSQVEGYIIRVMDLDH